jgi:DNA-binding ferritin-like protein (Dps family)
MIKNFSQYLIEEEREVFFTFGRMNPPTIGHGKVMDVLAQKSGKKDYKVFVSQTQDAKKNPLSYSDKIKHVRKMFPKHARQVMVEKNVKTAIHALVSLYDKGYRSVTMVVGDDRIREFEVLFNKYNGQHARHGFYNFKSINIVSAGKRDPDAEGVEGMSASKQRENAANNDFVSFSQGVPKSMSNADARRLFNDVRKGMGLAESSNFRNHLELESVSERREKFVLGELFSVGDEVVVTDTDELATVAILGTNYIIVETHEGKRMRKWLDAVELVSEEVSQKELDDLEKFGDRLLNKFDVDIEFTRHFKDRMNDPRNKPAIKVSELQSLFQKMADNKGKKIKKHGNSEAILKDMQSDLNLPVVINWKNGEFEVVNKTIMRKKAFKSPDPELKYESQDPDIKDREGSQPARYHAGLEKSTKVKRDAHFKKHGKKADDDASAYKPAPGDATAKTKPSKYTKSFKDMYNEDCLDGYSSVTEGAGAGDEGSDRLKKKYVKDTPHMEIDERSWSHDIATFAAKTVSKDKYSKVAKHAIELMNKSGTEKNRGVYYWAGKVIRMYNLKMNSRTLGDLMDKLK